MDYECDHQQQPTGPGSDELLRLVFESAVDYAIFSMDSEGCVTSWNTGAERLLGHGEMEIMGRTADVIFTPEDRAAGVPEQERAQARAAGRAADDRWTLRKDGSRFWAAGLMMPLADPGRGFVKILRDRTEQHRAEGLRRREEERFRLLATNIPQLVFRCEADGNRTWGSPQWIEFTGLSPEESRGFGWLDAVHPDDVAATLAAWQDADARGESHVEHRIRRASDGQYRWHQTRARPIGGGDGDWVGTMADVHDLRDLQDRQQVLMAELQHRTRNLLAVTQAVAKQTLRNSPSLATFATQFDDRLRALGRVQALLARTDRQDIDLRELVLAELGAHREPDATSDKVRIEGPSVRLPATSAQAIGLALHELATNAVKYGALSRQMGRLAVIWRVEPDGGGPRLLLEWAETGVDMSTDHQPRRIGYGSELIERALPYQLGADTTLQFGPEGVRCTITVPLPRKAEKSTDG